ncbi:unnamed protein product, partial [Brachionus calyciflorus]
EANKNEESGTDFSIRKGHHSLPAVGFFADDSDNQFLNHRGSRDEENEQNVHNKIENKPEEEFNKKDKSDNEEP